MRLVLILHPHADLQRSHGAGPSRSWIHLGQLVHPDEDCAVRLGRHPAVPSVGRGHGPNRHRRTCLGPHRLPAQASPLSCHLALVGDGRGHWQPRARLPLHHSPNPHPLLRGWHAQCPDAHVHLPRGGGAVWHARQGPSSGRPHHGTPRGCGARISARHGRRDRRTAWSTVREGSCWPRRVTA